MAEGKIEQRINLERKRVRGGSFGGKSRNTANHEDTHEVIGSRDEERASADRKIGMGKKETAPWGGKKGGGVADFTLKGDGRIYRNKLI